MLVPKDIPLAGLPMPPRKLQAKVAACFVRLRDESRDPNEQRFAFLVSRIDEETQRIKGIFENDVVRAQVVAKIIIQEFSGGDTDQKVEAGIELMNTPEGPAMLQELLNQRPSAARMPDMGLDNTAEHPHPAVEQSLPVQRIVSTNKGLPIDESATSPIERHITEERRFNVGLPEIIAGGQLLILLFIAGRLTWGKGSS